MNDATTTENHITPCGFCDKYGDEVDLLMSGYRAVICNECVDAAAMLVEEQRGKNYIKFLRET